MAPDGIAEAGAALVTRLRKERAADERRWIRVKDAAPILGLGITSVRALMRDGRLLFRFAGGATLLSMDSIYDLLVEQAAQTYRPGRKAQGRRAVLDRERPAAIAARSGKAGR
jgi:hypothetical protein